MLNISSDWSGDTEPLIALFAAAFGDAEGPEEGALIGALVRDLLTETPAEDIAVFVAREDGDLVAAGIFTRLDYPQDPQRVALLSPMAVRTDRQGQSVGQRLLRHALDALAERFDAAVTYGDPRYYGKLGFLPIPEAQAAAPLPLSMPHGWLGQALPSGPMPALRGPSRCAAALMRPDIW